MIIRFGTRWHWQRDRRPTQTNVVHYEAQKWWHNTPMADEQLLPEATTDAQRECRSAWDDDDDDIDRPSEIEAAMHIITDEQFLIESAQDRLYVELGDQVYDI